MCLVRRQRMTDKLTTHHRRSGMRDQIGTDRNELVLIIGSCSPSDISETTPNKSIGFQRVCIW